MVHTVDGGGSVRRNFHPADLNKDGKVTRSEAQQYVDKKVPAAKPEGEFKTPVAKPKGEYKTPVADPKGEFKTPVAKPKEDVNATRYPTVGEHIENTLTEAKNEFFESAKIAGVMAIPGVNVAAGVVYARHMSEARKEIAQLPMDPEGKWKDKARDIISRHHEAAEDEIIALPGKVVDGAVDAVDKVVDGAVDTAEAVWGGVTDAAEAAWDFAKTEVPRAAKELGRDAAVLAIMANPLGAVPSGVIISNHMAQANKRIMDLPMDPEGKWKSEARAIVREEMAEAKQEILDLPGKAWQGVKDVSNSIYTGARNAVVATGEAIVDAGEAVVDGVVMAGEAIVDAGETVVKTVDKAIDQTVAEITENFEKARKGLGGAFERFGRWIAGN